MIRQVVRTALFLLPVLILLPHLGDFAFQPASQYSDMLISHYPNGLFLQKTIHEQGTIPLWSPAILSGYPFVANPLSGLSYLPGWIALLLPLPLGFNLVLSLHLILGGVGMFFFLRSEGLPESPALFGALVYEAMPKLYGHLGAGHLTLIYAVAWTPWLLYVEKRTSGTGRLGWLLPGTVLGILALADVRWAAYAGLLWAAYGMRIFLGRPAELRQGWLWFASRISNLAMAGLTAAPLLLPLAQHTRLASRAQMTAHESLVLSLPPAQLIGLVYPNIGGPAEWLLYPGAVILVLVLYNLLVPPARRRAAFWLGLVAASLVFAMGESIPLLDLAIRLPGMSLLRVPPRVLLLSGFGFSVLAAQALYSVSAAHDEPGLLLGKRAKLSLFAAAAFVGLFAAAVWLVVEQALPRLNFTWGAVFFVIGALLVWWAHSKRLKAGLLTVLLVSVSLIDLVGVNGLSLTFQPADRALTPGRSAAVFLAAQGRSQGSFRVYSPSYSIPQYLAAEFGLELADGVDPLQLKYYTDFMTRASGVPDTGYSVTLPPFASAQPAVDNQHFRPDPVLLGLLNVQYVAAEFPIQNDQLEFLAEFGKTRVYRNLAALPRAWVQPAQSGVGKKIASLPWVSMQANQISLLAEGPGLLILSEIVYPGWQVSVDGQPVQLEQVDGLLRGVQLGEGEHTVEFSFRPLPFYLGLGLAALAWAVLGFLMVLSYRQRSLVRHMAG